MTERMSATSSGPGTDCKLMGQTFRLRRARSTWVWGDRACAFRLWLPPVEVDGSSEPPPPSEPEPTQAPSLTAGLETGRLHPTLVCHLGSVHCAVAPLASAATSERIAQLRSPHEPRHNLLRPRQHRRRHLHSRLPRRRLVTHELTPRHHHEGGALL